MRAIACTAVLLSLLPGAPPPSPRTPEAVPSPHDAAARKLLLAEFEALLAGPGTYEATVRRECRAFPERDLLPYILPALAYTNLGLSDPAFRPKARRRVAQLIDLARPAVARRAGKLEDLDGYRRQAVYLGQYNLALGGYRLLGGDDRYARQHQAISDALHAGLARIRRGVAVQIDIGDALHRAIAARRRRQRGGGRIVGRWAGAVANQQPWMDIPGST